MSSKVAMVRECFKESVVCSSRFILCLVHGFGFTMTGFFAILQAQREIVRKEMADKELHAGVKGSGVEADSLASTVQVCMACHHAIGLLK